MAEVRALALRVATAGLEACDVGRATEEAVGRPTAGSRSAGREYALDPDARVIVVGSGKATLAIAATLERMLGDRLDGGAVVVRDGADAIALDRVEVLVADHPLPSRALRDARPPARRARRPRRPGRPGARLVHRRQLGADQPAAAGRQHGREAPPARAAARLRRADRRGQRGPQARLGDQGRAAGGADRPGAPRQPDRLRRRRRRARRDHRPDRPGHARPCRTRSRSCATAGSGTTSRRAIARPPRERRGPLAPPRPRAADRAPGDRRASVCEAMAAEAAAAGAGAHVVSTELEGEARSTRPRCSPSSPRALRSATARRSLRPASRSAAAARRP